MSSGSKYVVCLNNKGFTVSLQPRKIYQTLPDAIGEKHGMIRVIDDEGEDYLYPADYFVPIALPAAIRRVFVKAAS